MERAAAVHEQAEHRVKALGEQVMVRVLKDRVWVGCGSETVLMATAVSAPMPMTMLRC